MNLKQLYKTTNWGEVKDFLLQLYPDQKRNVAGYEKVYTDLAQIEPEETALELFLRYIEEENPEIVTFEEFISTQKCTSISHEKGLQDI